MLVIRKCRKCGRTFDARAEDKDCLCQVCQNKFLDCSYIDDTVVYLKDARSDCDEPEPETPVMPRKLAKMKSYEQDAAQFVLDNLTTVEERTAMRKCIDELDELDLALMQMNLTGIRASYDVMPQEVIPDDILPDFSDKNTESPDFEADFRPTEKAEHDPMEGKKLITCRPQERFSACNLYGDAEPSPVLVDNQPEEKTARKKPQARTLTRTENPYQGVEENGYRGKNTRTKPAARNTVIRCPAPSRIRLDLDVQCPSEDGAESRSAIDEAVLHAALSMFGEEVPEDSYENEPEPENKGMSFFADDESNEDFGADAAVPFAEPSEEVLKLAAEQALRDSKTFAVKAKRAAVVPERKFKSLSFPVENEPTEDAEGDY